MISCSTSILSIKAYPLVLANAPIKILINVDLPAPFSPNNATIYPFLRVAVTPFNANTLLL